MITLTDQLYNYPTVNVRKIIQPNFSDCSGLCSKLYLTCTLHACINAIYNHLICTLSLYLIM